MIRPVVALAGQASCLTKAVISILASITCGAGNTHSALAIPRTVTEDAKGSIWIALTWQAETKSVIEVKVLFAGITVKTLISQVTITLACSLIAVLHIQTSNLRTVTYILSLLVPHLAHIDGTHPLPQQHTHLQHPQEAAKIEEVIMLNFCS